MPVFEIETIITYREHLLVEASSAEAAEKKLEKRFNKNRATFITELMPDDPSDFTLLNHGKIDGYEPHIK